MITTLVAFSIRWTAIQTARLAHTLDAVLASIDDCAHTRWMFQHQHQPPLPPPLSLVFVDMFWCERRGSHLGREMGVVLLLTLAWSNSSLSVRLVDSRTPRGHRVLHAGWFALMSRAWLQKTTQGGASAFGRWRHFRIRRWSPLVPCAVVFV